jgi:uncharacterized membrane protein
MSEDKEALAKSRFMVLSALRLFGVLILMGGFVLVAGKWEIMGGDADRYLGMLFVLVGAFDFAVAPMLLARSWNRTDRA